MINIGCITGSTRPDRISLKVAEWVKGCGETVAGADFKIIDLKERALPFIGTGDLQIFKAYREEIESFDAFVFVLPEYNHGMPAVLKNALDAAYHEWKNKPLAIVSYGFVGGARSAEQLRAVGGALGLFDIREQILLFLGRDIDENGELVVTERKRQKQIQQLDSLVDIAKALKIVAKKK